MASPAEYVSCWVISAISSAETPRLLLTAEQQRSCVTHLYLILELASC